MKLFKSLLVAPATLGLLVPMSATANEINFTDVSGYSSSEEIQSVSDFDAAKEIAVTNSRVDGLEAKFNNFEAGAFSETTTASFSADFGIGAVQGLDVTTAITDGNEDLEAVYGFQIDLNTSFTGEDSLDISLDAGNTGSTALGELDLTGGQNTAGADVLAVDGVSYTFPLGDATVIVGDNTDGSALFNIACTYGGGNTLDDCGTVKAGITGGGVALGASYDIGYGVSAAVGFQFIETGIATEGNADQYAFNLAYSGDNYGVSYTYAAYENGATHTDSYNAINGYYSFDNSLSVSAGYEVGALQNASSDDNDETESYFIGVSGEVGPGELGAAYGSYGTLTEASAKMPERNMYEVYYSYAVNDGMTIKPLVYTVEGSSATDEDETGIMVKTSFSF